MTLHTLPRTLSAGMLAITTALSLTGCEMAPGGEVGENMRILDTCPADGQKVASLVLADGTTSGRTEDSDEVYLQVIEQIARRTAICGGRLTVAAFSSSSGSTIDIFDDEIELEGATDISRMRKVSAEVEAAMEEITDRYDTTISALPDGGTDVVGLYRLFGEHTQQLPDYRLEGTVLTDGLNNRGLKTARILSAKEATMLADGVSVPSLSSDASITVAGLGRTAEGTVPSASIDGLVTFYTRLCENTGAGSCLAVTDWR